MRYFGRTGRAAVGPLAVVADQRLGLLVIDLKALQDGLFLVVVALDQRLAGDVVLALDLGRIELDVIGAAGGDVHATTAHAGDDLAVRHVDFEHVVDRHAGILHGLGLRNGARETVEHVAALAVGFLEAILDQADDDVVADQAAGIHDLLGFEAQRRAGLDGGAQHVAGGNLRNAEFLLDEVGLGALAGAGWPQQNQSHIVSLDVRTNGWIILFY